MGRCEARDGRLGGCGAAVLLAVDLAFCGVCLWVVRGGDRVRVGVVGGGGDVARECLANLDGCGGVRGGGGLTTPEKHPIRSPR